MADVLMPRLSDTMEEGTIVRWVKHPGDRVSKGEVLAEIETDKATMNLEAYEDGVLQHLLVEEGATASIGTRIAVVGPEAASGPLPPVPVPEAAAGTQEKAPAPPAGLEPGTTRTAFVPTVPNPTAAGPRSSPLARALARRHGLDLARTTGSGPGGRVVRADVEAAIARQTGDAEAAASLSAVLPRPDFGDDQVEEVPLTSLRRLTAERLTQGAHAPHFDLTIVVDAQPMLALRAEVNRAQAEPAPRATVTDLLVKACAVALRTHPEVNTAWGGDRLLRHRRVNVGVAMAVPKGLVVPVVRDADRKTLSQVVHEAHALAERARQERLSLDDLEGGTFTISNLGMYGIDHFRAVINPPQAAILAVGAATDEPVVRDGRIVVGKTMRLTLSVDHRVLDGAMAAAFLADLRGTLLNPVRMLV